jgi:serpin B
MKKFFSLILIFSMFFFLSCGEGDDNDNKDDSEVTDSETDDSDSTSELEVKYQKADEHAADVSKEIVDANSGFAGEIFSALCEEGKNIMISPLSISIALGMATNGASGENLDEMKEVMGFGEMTMEDVNAQFFSLISSLIEADKDMVLSIANSVWMDDEFEPRVKEAFLSALEDSYAAEPYTLDFADAGAPDTINQWVSDNTNGKIEKIVDQIGADTVMYLINAIYFKAAWTVTFDEEKTYEGNFTKSDGSTVKADFMTYPEDQEFDFYSSGYEDDDYSIVRLPYGREKFAFYGIIPNGNGTVDDLIADMKENGIDSYFENLSKGETPVILPKFKFEWEKSLVDVFKSLGMEKAFVEGGFLDIAENGEGIYISDIKHKTFIEVNEAGTEAAAVTSVEFGETSMPEGFYGYKPFVYIIRDDRSGTILFMGKVEDPTVEK